jgi:acyl-CoA synthetase (AMP-forming)/AMP-acid ligase II
MSNHALEQLLFGNVKKENVIADDRVCVGFSTALEAIEKLKDCFEAHRARGIGCLAVTVKNDVNHALIVLALIAKRINFFVHSSNAANLGIPHFCDARLVLDAEGVEVLQLAQAITLQKNSEYTGQQGMLKPASGAVIFASSGTTGTPKYVYYQSDKLIRNAVKCIERFGVTTTGRVLVPVPISHMYGMGVGMLPAIIAGASLCLVEKNNVVKLIGKLAQFTPDLTLLTPPVCRMLLLLNKKNNAGGIYITAGDRLKKEAHRDFEANYGKLINLYGCTELGAIATSGSDSTAAERAEGIVVPLKEVKVRIAHPEKGEISCRHDACFDFYINGSGEEIRARETDDSFYNTKDLGLAAEDGKFKVLGRIDHCINRNGFLVSLQEVESAIEQVFAEFNQVVVLSSDAERIAGKALIAVCETRKDYRPDIHNIRSLCKDRMPNHWVPDEFHFVTDLPKLNNGKLDRNALTKLYA